MAKWLGCASRAPAQANMLPLNFPETVPVPAWWQIGEDLHRNAKVFPMITHKYVRGRRKNLIDKYMEYYTIAIDIIVNYGLIIKQMSELL